MKSGPFYGWVVVETAFAVLLMAYGAQFAFGIFFAALLEEFGWSRAGLSGAFALYVFLYSAFGLVSGRLTDLWGPRSPISSVRRAASWAFSSQWRAPWPPGARSAPDSSMIGRAVTTSPGGRRVQRRGPDFARPGAAASARAASTGMEPILKEA